MTTTTMSSPRLATIVSRHKKTWVRDVLFAACVMLTTAVSIVSIATVSTASRTASSQLVQR